MQALELKLSSRELVERYLGLDEDPRFLEFAGKIEINEYGDFLVNAASRLHVVVQNRLAAFIERHLGGESMTEMPVTVKMANQDGVRLRVPDISWSSITGFFDGPIQDKVLSSPAELCVEIKSDSNTLKDLREKRDELLSAGAKEVWFVFPERRAAEFYGKEGLRATSTFSIDITAFWSKY